MPPEEPECGQQGQLTGEGRPRRQDVTYGRPERHPVDGSLASEHIFNLLPPGTRFWGLSPTSQAAGSAGASGRGLVAGQAASFRKLCLRWGQ